MNKTYRLIWNELSQSWVPASELCRSRGKRSGKALLLVAGALLGGGALAQQAQLLPSGGQIVSGSGSIAQSGNTLTVTQTSQKLGADWQSFSIGAGQTVNFVQPSSNAVALNRVVGSEASQIFGRLNANGQVFLVNPNGVLFARGAEVSAAGILASTRDLSQADFAAGRYRLSGSSSAAVRNEGSLRAADGGYVALVGAQVSNAGSISTSQGEVRLAAADTVSLRLDGHSLTGFSIDKGTLDGLADNKGLLRAEGGRVYLTAEGLDQLARAVVNNEGLIEAASVGNLNGRIVLNGTLVSNTGSLAASGTTSAGQIELTGRSILQAGEVRADGADGQVRVSASQDLVQTAGGLISASGAARGGRVQVDGGDSTWLSGKLQADGQTEGGQVSATGGKLTLTDARLSADGGQRGGELLLGGDLQGKALAQGAKARDTQVNSSSRLSARGAQGRIIVWSDDKTRYAGQAETGAGGFIEVSAKDTLQYQGRANPGQGGQLLLDPTNIVIGAAPDVDYINIYDPNPGQNNKFGSWLQELSNGNLLVSVPFAKIGGVNNAGAVYLFDGKTGALISALYGSRTDDKVGFGRTSLLSNGHFVVASDEWSGQRGAVTWGSALTGVSGVVSASNSLVGTLVGDMNYSRVTPLSNGNYVISSWAWNAKRGAATWANGSTGITGEISASNSLVGSKSGDTVAGSGITALSNGNYVVRSTDWNDKFGAVTWGSGLGGTVGEISASNSLIGSQRDDQIGSMNVFALSNGNYVVASGNWNQRRGAVTWGNGSSGSVGTVGPSNSLVGSSVGDGIGGTIQSEVRVLPNGNYVVTSPSWSSWTGAATWADGSKGISGEISALNSLVGSQNGDQVGNGGIAVLSNGNYVVMSRYWANGSASKAGAATWGSGATGVRGVVGAANSLVGTSADDGVGSVYPLKNGHYVVASYSWDKGSLKDAGAVTWGNGDSGTTGAVSAANSLVGTAAGDAVGSRVSVLSNGHYVVVSPDWSDAGLSKLGAVTWIDGGKSFSGQVGAANSLVGSASNDRIGSYGIYALSNGNYVVLSPEAGLGGLAKVGAATWGSGTGGLTGVISAANSLIGSQANDQVGSGITALSNGNYVVLSPNWANGSAASAGAATWADGSKGISGQVSSSNSLVGSRANDQYGSGGIALKNGHYLVSSGTWDHGSLADAGIVTWGNGLSGSTGVAGAHNSLVGKAAGDHLGYNTYRLTALANGNYLVANEYQTNGSLSAAGMLLLADGSRPTTGSPDPTIYPPPDYTPAGLAELAAAGTTTTLQASNNITVNAAATVAGRLNLVAGNTLTLNAALSSTAEGDALVMVAGQRFVNKAGSAALNTPNGRWLVWSAKPASDERGGLVPAFKQYDASHGSSAVLGSGNGFLYGLAPTLDVWLSGSFNKDYDGTRAASGGRLVARGLIDGDEVQLNHTGINYENANAGRGKKVLVEGIEIASARQGATKVYGYKLVNTSAASLGNIDRKLLSVDLQVADKVYDGKTDATLEGISLQGLVAGETLKLKTGAATFQDKNAGQGKTVTVQGVSLSDGSGQTSNYMLASAQAVGKASITPRVISEILYSKVYDGSTDQSASTGYFARELSDSMRIEVSALQFDNKNAGENKGIKVDGLRLTGEDARNYKLADQLKYTGQIYQKLLDVTQGRVLDKFYDGEGSTVAGAVVKGVVAGDQVEYALVAAPDLVGDSIPFVGKNLSGSIVAVLRGGADAGNYRQGAGFRTTWTIAPRPVTLNALAQDKVYDGSRDVQLSLSSKDLFTGRYDLARLDNLGFSIGSAQFADKNAGQGKTVNVQGITLTGPKAQNYVLLNSDLQTTANITPKTLNLSASAQDKVYDGQRDALVQISSSGQLAGDKVGVTAGLAQFADRNAGRGKVVTVSQLGLNGEDAGNYTLASDRVATTASITPKLISASASVQDKVYDGQRQAQVGVHSSGVLGEDQVVFGTEGLFADKNAGRDKTVTVRTRLGGADAGNYRLEADTLQATASITPRTLNVNANVQDKVYDGRREAQASLSSSDLVSGDRIEFTAGSALFADRNAGQGKAVAVEKISLRGEDAGNYLLSADSLQTKGNITPKRLDVSASAQDKVYDGQRQAQVSLSLSGLVGDDQVGISGQGQFEDRNAGQGKTVMVETQLSGAHAGNYRVDGKLHTTASISAKAITVNLDGTVSKIQDGDTQALLQSGHYRIEGLVDGERLVLTRAYGHYDDAKTGQGKTVSVNLAAGDYRADTPGTELGNYRLVQGMVSGTVGEILARTETPTSLPTLPSGASVVRGFAQPQLSGSSEGEDGTEKLANKAQRPTENMLAAAPVRRTFDITAAGVRLPAGLRADD